MSTSWTPISLFYVAASLLLVQCVDLNCPDDYDRSQYLDDQTRNYLLCWTVDWHHKVITFAAKVATTGWFGFGISQKGYMPNSDVLIGWVKDGKGFLQDRFAFDRSLPPLDPIQNVRLISAREEDGTTTLEFRRKLEACERRDHSIEKGTTRIIFSYNPHDPESEDALSKHTIAGRVSVSLLSGTGNVEPAPLESDHKSFLLGNPSVRVPARPTTYWCVPFELPTLQSEAHVIRFEPVIQENHKQLVHHILIYQCSDDVIPHLQESWDCDHPLDHIPPHIRTCRGGAVVYAWAIGGTALSFPSNAGYPFSGATGIQYVVMETHYNNPESSPSYVDSSGVKMYYTPTKRPHDAATLMLGHHVSIYSYQLLMPSRKKDIILENICPNSCTQAGLPQEGVNVFASFLHSHTAGRGMWVKHIRNGIKLPDIDRNDNYDFDFQDVVLLENEVKILPGDDVQVFCRYHTSNRNQVTLGGLKTMDEMCLAFLFVYPKPKLSTCLSHIPWSSLIQYLSYASLLGEFVDNGNRSADTRTQLIQLGKDLKNMKFKTRASHQLWSQTYWSSRKREFTCSTSFDENLLKGTRETYLPAEKKGQRVIRKLQPKLCLDSDAEKVSSYLWIITVLLTRMWL
ncbi:DBH-like monooxygenase protein 1 homolog [Corticium candelabrum]|uniref:DBH-like monooxygenase protein 1 homolog n=1 Tax=Corticium candelabrum TaxID=121492 RepID=UPI002E253BBB|nr:DBH-like monooxygenase protein 1 homolog [Corticium candelabrum]